MGNEYFVTDGNFIYTGKYLPGNEWENSSLEHEIGGITHFCIPDAIEIE